MTVKGLVKKGEYYDSVMLMAVARRLGSIEGVADSSVVMGTKENKAILQSAGLLISEFEDATGADLLIAVKAEGKDEAEGALRAADQCLKDVRQGAATRQGSGPRSLESALKILPDANLALISVAGRYAGDVAMDCLHKGLHVMLFSDNVPLDKEIELKKYAHSKGLFVMGPDCGTAIINGVPLGFANAVRRGDVGIVAAAGTGLQEVSTILSNQGAGISQAIGTGGRDVKKDVGGVMFLQALKALATDSSTRVIVLVTKPPHPDVLERIRDEASHINKPTVVIFLGGDEDISRKRGLHAFSTLEEAALAAAALSKGMNPGEIKTELKKRDERLVKIASAEAKEKREGQRYLRGFFCGGTFASEAQLVLRPMIGDIYSNVPLLPGLKLNNSLESFQNTIIDFGEDEFTVGRPHPMIDYSLRNKRILAEASNPDTAVLLLDVVIGYGSNPQPAQDLAPAIAQAKRIASKEQRHLSIICSVTGTDNDPQCRSEVMRALEKAGASVVESNAAASRLAGYIIKVLA